MNAKKDSLQEDIQRRFNHEKKFIADADDEKPKGHGFIIGMSAIMMVIILISTVATFISIMK
ncbi:hypothetical protein [Fructilactobacillus carniphilus]|uniref:Uncharacterized protein n=1 Tax=Fructilactobacillus carniphilus TaxID=2940297 RepID=A0ABY5BYB6_9LACO|nr:hypothetical protein [Fructilactobacillus carniphilus]USS90025.1 hypothetical protein M3M37_03985 [Fructilactobacillus carniphilus]